MHYFHRVGWISVFTLLVGCASHPRIQTPVLPLSEDERQSVQRTALRLIPPDAAPVITTNSRTVFQNPDSRGAGALQGASQGAHDVLDSVAGSSGTPVAFVLLPIAIITGAVAGALAASLNVQPGLSVRSPTESALIENTLHPDLGEAFAKMGIEPVDLSQGDEGLRAEGFDSVIDVTLFTPVITGRRNQATFALLHKVQARSFDKQFEPRTWHREHISGKKPLREWLENDGLAIQKQMILLQAMLLRDFTTLLQPDM